MEHSALGLAIGSLALIASTALANSAAVSQAKVYTGLNAKQVLSRIRQYEVNWDSPSQDSTGSMPIGNGQLAANVWVDEAGILHLLLARTDSWSEISRLLKIGEVTIKLTPNPFQNHFHQSLRLTNGTIEIGGNQTLLTIALDPNQPVLTIFGSSQTPVSAHVTLRSWRTTRREIKGEEANSAWTMMNGPVKLYESADHSVTSKTQATIYHRNEESCVDFTLGFQGLSPYKNLIGDPLLHRTFGAAVEGAGLVAKRQLTNAVGAELESKRPTKSIAIKIASECGIFNTSNAFLGHLNQQVRRSASPQKIKAESAAWWHRFWDRSYVFVTPRHGASDQTKSHCFHVTQSYILQRFMMACAGRGAYPFKFNGSLFTVAPHWFGLDFNPDWRRWGDGYWWQNTRLPYWAMVANGDFDEMEPLFHLYESILPLSIARTKLYYKAKGTYFPETVSFFGTYANSDYGWNRKPGQAPGDFDAEWWKYAWNQGLELVQMMLDRYNADPNQEFLTKELLPMSRQVIEFFDSYFPRDASGYLKLTPDQVVETYRNGVTNDTPCIAGLHAVLPRLLALRPLSKADQKLFADLYKILPPVAIKNGRTMPAETFDPQRFNVENAEFYAIWPFRLFGIACGTGAIAAKTFHEREIKDNQGWQYDGQTAALAGLEEEAKKLLIEKVGNSNPHFRFPAMWGPNYDWLPDQTQGGNIMLTLQSMLLQVNNLGDVSLVGSDWPKDWDFQFKLYSPSGSIIVASGKNGSVAVRQLQP